MPLNEVCDNLLKGKHGCKLKYTNNLLFNKQWCVPTKDLLYSMELCSLLCGSLNGRRVHGRIDTYICMVKCLHCSLEGVLHCYSAISQFKLKSLEKGVMCMCVCVYNYKFVLYREYNVIYKYKHMYKHIYIFI